jgi:hypothetical protein
METLSIESKKPFSLSLIESILSQQWRVELSPGDTLVVHGDKSRAYLHADDPSKENDIFRLVMDYSEVELAKSLIEKIADDPNFTVDNDFGTVLAGTEFVARCKAERGWDWRR